MRCSCSRKHLNKLVFTFRLAMSDIKNFHFFSVICSEDMSNGKRGALFFNFK